MTSIKQTISWLLLSIAVLGAAYGNPVAGQQATAPSGQNIEDPIRELNLSPEQRERIRAIREQLREERAAIGQRLRETNKALEDALDADSPNEAHIEKLIRDVAAAQADAMRMRILSEIRIRRVLTADQLVTLRRLRLEARRDRRIDNIRRRQDAFDGQRGLTDPRNPIRPLYRRALPQRRTRP